MNNLFDSFEQRPIRLKFALLLQVEALSEER